MNKPPPETTLEGYLERITYHNEETHFTIARFRTGKSDHPITVLGTLPNPNPGETLKISGTWEMHARYGEQLRIDTVEVVLPASVEGIKKYLASGFIKGIGPKTAARLIQHFREKTFEVIEKTPHRLMEVRGIGKRSVDTIVSDWKTHHAIRNLIQFLQENGIKTSHSAKILKIYGPEALDIIRADPYRLADDLPGIGFQIADTIAQRSGMIFDEFKRVQACILHLLQQITDQGHVCIHADQLLKRCASIFSIPADAFRHAVDALEDRREIVRERFEGAGENPMIYPAALFQAETGIANRLKALMSVPVAAPDVDPEKITGAVLRKLAIQPSHEQTRVLEGILSHRVAVITGGPGTGKTTLIRSLTAIFELLGKQILLAAPTGRAARRLTEVTTKKAETIHKLLGYSPKDGRFEKDPDRPLQADAVIIDEASMVDTLLMFHLLRAVPMQSRLILVGDVFQLPSVGPGNILSDLIQSEKIETFELKQIFRQTRESPIVLNAHMVRKGALPDFGEASGRLSAFCFIEEPAPEAVVEKIVDLCTHRIPGQFQMDSIKDIQILTPMHRGLVGTFNLNQVLQNTLNPNPVKIQILEGTFKLGDKVMHLRNNYSKDVFNGDIGTVMSIEKRDETLRVDYDGRTVLYDFTELDEITLAYAISVHKSQGSEYPAVIVPLTTQHYPLLQRNLLYTAISRGKDLVILIGTKKALGIALKNDKPRQRLSGLAQKLAGENGRVF